MNYDGEMQRLKTLVNQCIKRNIYVIIDLHCHDCHHREDLAKRFFRDVSKMWGKKPHVMYEIFNEPKQDINWNQLKDYHNKIIGVIRPNSNNLIICGNTHQNKIQFR